MDLRSFRRAADSVGGRLSLVISAPIERGSPHVENGYSSTAGYRRVCWFGRDYDFDSDQAAVVASLIQARECGVESVSELQLQDAVGRSVKIATLFRGHPAYGPMICEAWRVGGPVGSFALRMA